MPVKKYESCLYHYRCVEPADLLIGDQFCSMLGKYTFTVIEVDEDGKSGTLRATPRNGYMHAQSIRKLPIILVNK